MCTIIVTIRTVLWYVMSLAGTLMILVALFTNKWLVGTVGATNLLNTESIINTAKEMSKTVADGDFSNVLERDIGLFIKCTVPEGQKLFEGECIPNLDNIESLFTELDDDKYPHAWRGAVIAFSLGLALMVITDLFALLTLCCRTCVCCSVFTVCGSIQSFAGLLFTLGLVAFPAGWGSRVINQEYCAGESRPFMLGQECEVGFAFWLAVAGTICTCIASSLAICAYRSTKSVRCEARQDEGDKCICLP